MSKRNIAYVKPEEPSFLRRIKEQVGYKEGPTVDTKRADEGPVPPGDLEDNLEEQPTVVVLRPGDLTAEEVEDHIKQTEKEEEGKKADLEAPIVFKAPKKKGVEILCGPAPKKPKISKKAKTKSLLSFDDEEEEDC